MAARSWHRIRAERSKLTAEQRAEIDRTVQSEIVRMKLPELRRARKLSQEALADTLGIAQGDVSKLERRTDVYVRSLRRFVEAMGGRLHIVAEFPGAEPVEITGFGDIDVPAMRTESLGVSALPDVFERSERPSADSD